MSDLPAQPSPTAEPPTPAPGGPDAMPMDPQDRGQAKDLDPTRNPAVNDVVPDEVAAPDDEKVQEPEGAADREVGTTEEEMTGQADEDGQSEPPA